MTNQAPVAVNDAVSVRHDTQGLVSAPGVKANDSDPDGDALTAILVNGPSHAAAFHLNADGSADYTPAGHFAGTDTFTYKVNDGVADSNIATVTITVWNNAPTAQNDSYSTKHDTLLSVAAPGVMLNDSDPDGDPITAVLANGPSHSQSFTLAADGSFQYLPAQHYKGTDTFTYKVTDDIANSATVTVTINVWNNAPVANKRRDVYDALRDSASPPSARRARERFRPGRRRHPSRPQHGCDTGLC